MRSIDYVKKLSNIPNEFIEDMFQFYDENTLQTDFVIDLNVVAKWLGAYKFTLLNTLKRSYKHRIDYIITKDKNPNQKDPRNNNYKHVLITPDCFKRLCMLSRSKKGETVRSYFIDIENTFIKYRRQTLEGIQLDMQRTKFKPETGYVYVLRVDEDRDLIKLGSTNDMNKRMSVYKTGRGREMEVLYLYETDNLRQIEGCVKAWLQGKQYFNKQEIYAVDVDVLKKLITQCASIGTKLHLQNKWKEPDNQRGGYFVVFKKKTTT